MYIRRRGNKTGKKGKKKEKNTRQHWSVTYFMCTLYFSFTIHCSVFTTTSLVSVHHQTIDPNYPFHPPPIPSSLVITILCIHVFVFDLVIHFVFLFFKYPIYEWNHTIFVLPWLTSTTMMPSKSIHVVENGKILSFLKSLSSILLYTFHILLYPFIYWWALSLLPYLGYCK